jgi:carbon-monoxide dehydrogenase medium subunit
MKTAGFRYHRPGTIEEATALLASLSDARVLAGGQSLMPMLNLRVAAFQDLIDINRVAGLDGIEASDGTIRLGAMTRQQRLQTDPIVRRHLPLMAEALSLVGHTATRNRGTLGGSLCHLDPAAELPVVAAAFDARIEIVGRRGRRILPMAEFPAGLMTPAIEPDELVVAVEIAPWSAGHGWAFVEFARRPGDFAIVAAAAMIDAPDGRVRRARLVLGGLQDCPMIVPEAERLVGQTLEPALLAEIAAACRRFDAFDDPHAPSWYRQRLAGVMAGRALSAAARRALDAGAVS